MNILLASAMVGILNYHTPAPQQHAGYSQAEPRVNQAVPQACVDRAAAAAEKAAPGGPVNEEALQRGLAAMKEVFEQCLPMPKEPDDSSDA
jgi:antirestriction protein ArdC